MAGKRKTEASQKPIEQYEHKDKQRLNNPPVGLVDVHTAQGNAVAVKIIDARGIESSKIIKG